MKQSRHILIKEGQINVGINQSTYTMILVTDLARSDSLPGLQLLRRGGLVSLSGLLQGLEPWLAVNSLALMLAWGGQNFTDMTVMTGG